MKKKVIIPAAAIVIVIGAGAIIYNTSDATSAADMETERPTASVTTTPSYRDIESTVTASGTVELDSTDTVYSDTEQNIDEILVDEGDLVNVGDVLLTYDIDEDRSDIEDSINEMEIELENSYLSLANIITPLSDAEVMNYEENIRSREQSITDAENNLLDMQDEVSKQEDEISNQEDKVADAKVDMDNYEILYNQGLESLNTYDSYIDAYDDAVDELDTLNTNYTSLLRDLETAQTDISDAEYDLDIAQKEYEIAQNPLSDSSTLNQYQQQSNSIELKELQLEEKKEELTDLQSEVVSDYVGTVTELVATDGTAVTPGNEILVISNYDDLIVTSTVSQYDLENVYEGQAVTMYTDDDEDKIYTGEIIDIGEEAVASTVNNGTVDVVPIEISLDGNDEGLLKVGFSVNADIVVADVKDILTVPSSSIATDINGDFVFVVENEILNKTYVETGYTDDSYTEITSGISDADEVLISASSSYEDGSNINELTIDTTTEDSSIDEIMPGGATGGGMGGGGMGGGGTGGPPAMN